MKIKYYLRGIGIGIILTTIILSIVNKSNALTDQDIIDKARELGMIMEEDEADDLYSLLENVRPTNGAKPNDNPPDNEDKNNNESIENDNESIENDNNEEDISDKIANNSNIENNDKIEDNETIENNDQTENNDKVVDNEELENDTDISNSEDVNVITFTIKSGMSSEAVSKLLMEKELIKDSRDFNSYIKRAGKANVIRIGTYTLSVNSTYDDIIKAITKRK